MYKIYFQSKDDDKGWQLITTTDDIFEVVDILEANATEDEENQDVDRYIYEVRYEKKGIDNCENCIEGLPRRNQLTLLCVQGLHRSN